MKNKFTKKDALYPEAKKLALKTKNLTIAKIQKNLKTGFRRSWGLMDMLKTDGVVKVKAKKVPTMVKLEKLYKDKDWKHYKGKPVIPLGAETSTHNLLGNLANDFNLILAGATGSGKSNFFHCAMVNLLRNSKTKDLKFILIDPKRVEFSLYEKLPNLIFPVILNSKDAKKALQWCIDEIDRRFWSLLNKKNTESIDDYNKNHKRKIPRVVVVIDECSDLMSSNFRFFKKAILNILKLGNLTGVNILMGTSRLSPVNVYPKKLVDAFQYRVAFATASTADSKAIIGDSGAEKLRGKGDMLLKYPEEEGTTHLQGFYISEKEVKKVVASVKS